MQSTFEDNLERFFDVLPTKQYSFTYSHVCNHHNVCFLMLKLANVNLPCCKSKQAFVKVSFASYLLLAATCMIWYEKGLNVGCTTRNVAFQLVL